MTRPASWPSSPASPAAPTVLLVLQLGDWSLGGKHRPPAEALAVTGLDAIATRLGTPVRPADPATIYEVARTPRRVWLRGDHLHRGITWGRLTTALIGGALALIAFSFFPNAYSNLGALITLAAVAVLHPVVALFHRERRDFVRLASGPPPPQDHTETRTEVRTILSPDLGGLADARLQIGRHWIVLHDRGSETWIPGPALGGVTHVIIDQSSRAIVFYDHADHPLLHIESNVWSTDPAGDLLTALRHHAITTTPGDLPRGQRTDVWRTNLYAAYGTPEPSVLMSHGARGGGSRTILPWLCLATWLNAVANGWSLVDAASRADPLTATAYLALVATTLAHVVLTGTAVLRLALWNRRHRTHCPPGTTPKDAL